MDKLEGIIFIIIFLVAASGFTYQETQINEKKDDLFIQITNLLSKKKQLN